MDHAWVIFALAAAFTAGLVAIFTKIGLEGVDTNAAATIRTVIMAIFLLGMMVFQGKLGAMKSIFSDSRAVLFIVLSGVVGAFSLLFYFMALKNASVSQVVPIDRMSVVFALVLAFLFLGEGISLKAAIGAALVVAGGIIIALG